jgi:hypothetical protein
MIVEVKVLRVSSDLQRLESEIAEDLALYFKDGNPFTNMIVYVYDDRDKMVQLDIASLIAVTGFLRKT